MNMFQQLQRPAGSAAVVDAPRLWHSTDCACLRRGGLLPVRYQATMISQSAMDKLRMSATSNEHRASNGIFYRLEGKGEPLLLLHGLMVSGAMFDPLVELEAGVLLTLMHLVSPSSIGKLVVYASKPKCAGDIALTREQAKWLQSLIAGNRAPAMRGAVKGLMTFDSRGWLIELTVPTLVVGGTHDTAVPRHHFDTLVRRIPGAVGHLI